MGARVGTRGREKDGGRKEDGWGDGGGTGKGRGRDGGGTDYVK